MNILTREIIYLSRCVCYRSIRHIIATDVAFVAGVAALSAADVAAAPAAAPAVAVAAVSAALPTPIEYLRVANSMYIHVIR